MKRTIFLRFITFTLLLGYFSIILLSIFLPIIPFYKFWFSLLIMLLGISLLLRYFCYLVDTSLFIGQWLFLSGIVGIVNFYISFDLSLSFALYLASLAISSLTIFIKFRQLFHLKVFVFSALCAIVFVLYFERLIPLWIFISALSIIGLSLLTIIITTVKVNTRKI